MAVEDGYTEGSPLAAATVAGPPPPPDDGSGGCEVNDCCPALPVPGEPSNETDSHVEPDVDVKGDVEMKPLVARVEDWDSLPPQVMYDPEVESSQLPAGLTPYAAQWLKERNGMMQEQQGGAVLVSDSSPEPFNLMEDFNDAAQAAEEVKPSSLAASLGLSNENEKPASAITASSSSGAKVSVTYWARMFFMPCMIDVSVKQLF